MFQWDKSENFTIIKCIALRLKKRVYETHKQIKKELIKWYKMLVVQTCSELFCTKSYDTNTLTPKKIEVGVQFGRK